MFMLKYNCYKQNAMYYDYDYLSLCFIFNMKTLQNRCNIADSLFPNKTSHNKRLVIHSTN